MSQRENYESGRGCLGATLGVLAVFTLLTGLTVSAFAANPVQCISGSNTGVWVITPAGTYCQTK